MVHSSELAAATNGDPRQPLSPLGIQQGPLLRNHPDDPDGRERHRRVGLSRHGVDRLVPLGKPQDNPPPLPIQQEEGQQEDIQALAYFPQPLHSRHRPHILHQPHPQECSLSQQSGTLTIFEHWPSSKLTSMPSSSAVNNDRLRHN